MLILGYLLLLVLKFFGYSLAGRILNRSYANTTLSPWKVGAFRTLLGMMVGGLLTGGWMLLESMGIFREWGWDMGRVGSGPFFLLALVPLRIGEWFLTIWFFYDRECKHRVKALGFSLAGVLWSFLLDLPMILGLLLVVASIC